MQEEEMELQNLSKPGLTYPLFTPVGLEEGAAKLQQYLNEGTFARKKYEAIIINLITVALL